MMLFEAQGLTKTFGSLTVLNEVGFSLRGGCLTTLLGSNGAGKTTLLRLVSGLLSRDKGTFRLDGKEIQPQSPLWRQQLGVVFHKTFLYQNLTGLENLRLFSRLYQRAYTTAELRQKLDQVGLSRAADRLTRAYSRGMQQRLTIARALLNQPRALIMDEPFTGLDQNGSALLLGLLESLKKEGVLILMTTHDPCLTHALTDAYLRLSRASLEALTPSQQAPEGCR